MKSKPARGIILGSLAAAIFLTCLAQTARALDNDLTALRAIFAPLPKQADSAANPITPEKVQLGKKLYSDKLLSKDKTISCASCHDLATYGVDNKPTSEGHLGQRGNRNSPSVYNAALQFVQFWDGRAKDVEEQALGPVMNPVEMSMPTEAEVVSRLERSADYQKMFKAAFPEAHNPVTFKNIGRAIGAFERKLLTPSKFDKFLEGDDQALSEIELKGLRTFRDIGCIACHSGATVGGQMFQKIGLVHPYATKDLGRYEVTKNEADKYMFKVPALRNVEKTAPYFHDGGVATLDQAVKLMGYHQLGRTLTDDQVFDILTFLKTLTGEIPEVAKD